MRTHRLRLLLATALLVALVPTVAVAVPDELTEELEDARSRLAELDATVSQAVEQYNAATARLERLEARRDDTRGRVDALADEVAQLEEATSAFLRSMYMRGPATGLTSALGSSGVTEAGRSLAMMDRITRQRHAEVERLAARRSELDQARDQLARQVEEAEARQQELAERREEVERLVASQRAEVAELQDEIARIEEQERQERLAAERRAREEAARQAAAAQETPAPSPTPETSSPEPAPEPTTSSPSPTTQPSSPPPAPEPAPEGTRKGADTAVQAALSQVGKPYEWGAEGPDSYDCSGLTLWAWRHAGVELYHSSSAQYGQTARISRSQLQPGDLIFYGSPIHHVAMYIGDGQVVEAPYTGANVRVADAFDRSDIAGYGRV